MKYQNIIGLSELSVAEMQNINGGKFAYDVGTFLRAAYIYYTSGGIANPTVGAIHAAADYGANQVKCDCK